MKKQYNHTEYEQQIYEQWEDASAFSAPSGKEAHEAGLKPFSIIMPPPNANDPLHVGHALFVSLEDLMTRYHRMKGEAALWLPGADHAGIETQYVYEKKLKKEGKSRFSYDRETLYQKVWEYVQEKKGVAMDQIKKLGASADWERFTFTLDEEVVAFVINTFEKMHEDGLIYRAMRLVNYCTKCGTGYSDLEVEHIEETGKMYTLLYPFAKGEGGIEVATTRPETMLGDVAVAVHPEDKRYAEMVGKTVMLPLVDREIPIVADEYVDQEFGTGAVKITPYHDPNDFAVWERHKDEVIEPVQVINFQGKLENVPEQFRGLNVQQGREAVVKALKEQGSLMEVKVHEHAVGHCYRCNRVIEPLPMPQFYIEVEPLTKLALEALEKGETKVLGAGHDKILKHWLTTLKDWNISRQIVWGIRMPVWYEISNKQQETGNDEILVGFLDDGQYVQGKIGELLKEYSFEEIEANLQTLQAPMEAKYVISTKKPSQDSLWLQETDTFDTWFSSSQWPVVTLKNAKEGDFEFYYPTSVMETAYDILMFWVMRMIMMGLYLTGKTPFKEVYLHGLVRDERGEKMSKSKGNVVNPLDLVETYGADALRMALVMSTTPGHDSAVGESKVKGMRNFSNKIWNASRYIQMNRQELEAKSQEAGTMDGEFKNRLEEVVKQTTDELNRLKLGQAAETVHNQFWHWFCDECIEQSKEGEISLSVLEEGLQTFLKLIHPFMPFVTEATWHEMGYDREGMLITEAWPDR